MMYTMNFVPNYTVGLSLPRKTLNSDVKRIESCPHLSYYVDERTGYQNGYAYNEFDCQEWSDSDEDDFNFRNRKVKSALDLIPLRSGSKAVLWRDLDRVTRSSCLQWMTVRQINLQEAMFELITSEASYLKRLYVLQEHFMRSPLFSDQCSANRLITPRQYRHLFELIPLLIEVSRRFLEEMDERWLSEVISFDICDIVYNHAKQHFGIYAKYCSYQSYQEKCLEQLKQNPKFAEELHKLESDPISDNVTIQYFLILPVQRITKFPLLLEAVLKNFVPGSDQYRMCELALDKIKQIVNDCNEKTNEAFKREEMLVISNQFQFQDMKRCPLLTSSRWLVKKGEVVGFMSSFATMWRPSSALKSKHVKRIVLFAFNDLLIIAKKKNISEEKFQVLNYCPRNLIAVIGKPNLLLDHLPCGFKHIIQLGLLGTKKEDYLIACSDIIEKQAWIDVIAVKEYKEEKSFRFEEWDCPNVKSLYRYDAQLPDELSLEENDVLRVFRKNSDGWCFGQREQDGAKGWFPGNYTEEVPSVYIRARKLRESYYNSYRHATEYQNKKDEEKKRSNFYIDSNS